MIATSAAARAEEAARRGGHTYPLGRLPIRLKRRVPECQEDAPKAIAIGLALHGAVLRSLASALQVCLQLVWGVFREVEALANLQLTLGRHTHAAAAARVLRLAPLHLVQAAAPHAPRWSYSATRTGRTGLLNLD